jgi:anaerobic selenocysteine-containing dehydrogenase
MPTIIPRTCNVCEAMCGMLVTVENGRITDMRGDPEDPFSRGHICPKGPAMREIQEDPDRLRHPVRRTARGLEPVSWDEALAETARRLREVQARHGRDAIGVYLGNPTVHNHGAGIFVQGLLRALGTRNRFDANSVDANPKLLACLLMYGAATSIAVPDVDRTDLMLILGANPAASNGSLMTLGDVRGRMRGIRERGGRVILLDPRRTESAAWADEHHFIRPGGDAAFLLGVLHVLLAEGFVVDELVTRVADGLPAVRALAAPFPPERVTGACGVPAGTIRSLARAFGASRRAVCYGRVGTTLNEFGCEASWLIDVINVVTGNFDRAGGAMFPTPSFDPYTLGRVAGIHRFARWRSRVRGLPELGGQLPVATLAEEIETPGDGQIRALITLAGNPVLSTPNGARLERALAGLDFMVSLDFYANETTRHAHLILPPRYALEHPHIDIVFPMLAVRNYAKYSDTVLPPAPDTRDEWEILHDLTMRLGGPRLGRATDVALRLAWRAGLRVGPERLVDLAMRVGPRRLSLARVKAHPHGMDLGPLVPARRLRVHTPDRRVRLAPPLLVEQLPRLARWIDAAREDGLVLIGRRHLRTNNSWMHNCRSLVKGPDRATLLMHPGDAGRLGLSDGQEVLVRSRVGEVGARLEATDAIMPGVVSLPHGYGHGAARDTLRVAGALPGPNINLLSDEARVEPVAGTAILNGLPVTVRAAPARP